MKGAVMSIDASEASQVERRNNITAGFILENKKTHFYFLQVFPINFLFLFRLSVVSLSFSYIGWDLDGLPFLLWEFIFRLKRVNPKSLTFLHCCFSCTDPWSSLHPSVWQVESDWAHTDAQGSTHTHSDKYLQKSLSSKIAESHEAAAEEEVQRESRDGQKSRNSAR